MSYLKIRRKCYVPCVLLFLSFNLYFIFLMRDRHVKYLLYLDFLLLVFTLFFVGIDFWKYRKVKMDKEQALKQEDIICQMFPDLENMDIAEHDVQILNGKLQEKFSENCELQDYVAKCCHELKIPLAASLLMNEEIKETGLRTGMREQLERLNQQVNAMLLGCKLQSDLFDLQVKQVSLQECVRKSIRNQQFFLIQKGIALELAVGEQRVYTDMTWLVYILDQLISNAIKYTKEEARLRIWSRQEEQTVSLLVEDNGEGIRDCDIRRIFEKGFTGENQHNGAYKSTGMGLYMVSKITEKLGHEISVESEYGVYTRFCIVFRENDYFQF